MEWYPSMCIWWATLHAAPRRCPKHILALKPAVVHMMAVTDYYSYTQEWYSTFPKWKIMTSIMWLIHWHYVNLWVSLRGEFKNIVWLSWEAHFILREKGQDMARIFFVCLCFFCFSWRLALPYNYLLSSFSSGHRFSSQPATLRCPLLSLPNVPVSVL